MQDPWIEDEEDWLDRVLGTGEVGLALGSSALQDVMGAAFGIGRYITDAATVPGSQDASNAWNYGQNLVANWGYEPRTAEGQRQLQSLGDTFAQGASDLYNNGFLGVNLWGPQALSMGQSVWDSFDEDTQAGAMMALGASDLIPGMGGKGAVLGGAGGLIKNARRAPGADVARRIAADAPEPEPYPIQPQIQQRPLTQSRGRHRRNQKTGQYIGGPEGINSPQKLSSMRRRVENLAIEGMVGRDWYDRSTQAARNLTADRDANRDLYVGNVAVTSRGASVPSNQGFAIKGYNQAIAGHDIDTGRFPNKQGEAISTIARGEQYDGGPKEIPFFEGLTIDRRPEGVRPTNDLWMARAFNYRRPDGAIWSEGLGDAQHRFMDAEINAIVNRLNRQKAGGFDDWTPEKVQASIWTAQKARMDKAKPIVRAEAKAKGLDWEEVGGEPEWQDRIAQVADKIEVTPEEMQAAARDFSDSLEEYTASIRYEAAPPPGVEDLGGYANERDYLTGINEIITDEGGRDRLALATGALTRPTEMINGVYANNVSPASRIPLLVGSNTGASTIDPASQALTNAIASGRGLNLGQETIGTTYARPAKAGDVRNMVVYDGTGNLTGDALQQLEARLNEEFGGSVIPLTSENGVQFAAIDASSPLPENFTRRANKIAKEFGLGRGVSMRNSGGLVGNTDWDGFRPSKGMADLDAQPLSPETRGRLERELQMEAGRIQQYRSYLKEQLGVTGDKVYDLYLKIMSEKGAQGVRDAVKAGTLPAVALALIGGGMMAEDPWGEPAATDPWGGT